MVYVVQATKIKAGKKRFRTLGKRGKMIVFGTKKEAVMGRKEARRQFGGTKLAKGVRFVVVKKKVRK